MNDPYWEVVKNPNGDGFLVAYIDAHHFDVSGQFDDEDDAQEYADDLNRKILEQELAAGIVLAQV